MIKGLPSSIDIDDFIKLLKSWKDYNYIQEEVFDESYDDNSYEDW